MKHVRMKKIIMVLMISCLLLTGCGILKGEVVTVNPLPDTTMENLTDAILSVSLEKGDAYVDDTGKMQMDLQIYNFDKYDMVAVSVLEKGNRIVTHDGEVKIKSMERNAEGVIQINGGAAKGGITLVTDDSGIFYAVDQNGAKIWHAVGEATIRVSVDFMGYDNIDPEATEAGAWSYDKWNGRVNSPLACAMLSVSSGYVECQGNAGWRDYHITVLSAETGEIRYRIYCDSEEREDYRVIMFSAWGKNASFMFDKYDEYFLKTRSLEGRTEMAFCRLQYQEGLSAEHKENYEAFMERCMYIERSARRNAKLIAKTDDVDRLQMLFDYNTIDEHNLAWVREEFEKAKANNCTKLLNEKFAG